MLKTHDQLIQMSQITQRIFSLLSFLFLNIKINKFELYFLNVFCLSLTHLINNINGDNDQITSITHTFNCHNNRNNTKNKCFLFIIYLPKSIENLFYSVN